MRPAQLRAQRLQQNEVQAMGKSPNPWKVIPIAGAIMGGLWAVGYSIAFGAFPAGIIWALPAAVIGALAGLLICAIWQISRCIS
jgi:hypothetical protein